MRKGDLRKQQILNTAEELFCTYGYEQTSIQLIIDHLNTSKGSFYHHFASKVALLEGICQNRASKLLHFAEESAGETDSAVRRLDTLLCGMIPFQEEKLRFLLMLLPVFSLPEGRTVRQYYCETLSSLFYHSVRNQILSGHTDGELFCRDADNSTSLLLFLVNRFWVQITDLIIQAEKTHSEPDLSECLRLTDCYRICIERFLFIPYGSISLTDLPSLRLLIDQIHNHWDSKI